MVTQCAKIQVFTNRAWIKIPIIFLLHTFFSEISNNLILIISKKKMSLRALEVKSEGENIVSYLLSSQTSYISSPNTPLSKLVFLFFSILKQRCKHIVLSLSPHNQSNYVHLFPSPFCKAAASEEVSPEHWVKHQGKPQSGRGRVPDSGRERILEQVGGIEVRKEFIKARVVGNGSFPLGI